MPKKPLKRKPATRKPAARKRRAAPSAGERRARKELGDAKVEEIKQRLKALEVEAYDSIAAKLKAEYPDVPPPMIFFGLGKVKPSGPR